MTCMRRGCAAAFSAVLLLGCNYERPQPQPKAAPQAMKGLLSGEPVSFDVNVLLSDKAMKTLAASKETIVVRAYICGQPAIGTNKKTLEACPDSGDIVLSEVEAERATPGIFPFSRVRLSKDLLSQVDRTDYELLINVYSGRKSSENNLLDCGIYQGSFRAVQEHPIEIRCKLIYGE